MGVVSSSIKFSPSAFDKDEKMIWSILSLALTLNYIATRILKQCVGQRSSMIHLIGFERMVFISPGHLQRLIACGLMTYVFPYG